MVGESSWRQANPIGEHVVYRKGHFRHELLLERGLIKLRHGNGNEDFHMLFGPPRGLRHGKTSWNMLTAACEFSSIVRASGHVGIAVTVYIMDGLLYSASVRLFKARHALWYDVLQQRGDAFDPLERCRDLVVGIRCKAHGVHTPMRR